MNISIKNLGPIKQADFTLGELTILCGKNNTGKTYATYALFGFLSFWHNTFSIKVSEDGKEVEQLLDEGSIEYKSKVRNRWESRSFIINI